MPPKWVGDSSTGVRCGPGGGPEYGAGHGANARVYGDVRPGRNAPGLAGPGSSDPLLAREDS